MNELTIWEAEKNGYTVVATDCEANIKEAAEEYGFDYNNFWDLVDDSILIVDEEGNEIDYKAIILN